MSAFPPAGAALQSVIPAYPYKEYSDDANIVSFFTAYNRVAQGYLNWFNETPLGVYSSPSIYGFLLDWIGLGVYGISRPVFQSVNIQTAGAYDTAAYNSQPYNFYSYSSTGQATYASDDIYKRVLTWYTYRGDGQNLSLRWLRRRVARFVFGINGGDIGFDDLAQISVVSSNIAPPPAPKLGVVPGVGSLAAASYSVALTYVTPLGETLASSPSTIGVPANGVFYVESPPWTGGATGYNVYVSDQTTSDTAYNMAPLNVTAYNAAAYPIFLPISKQNSTPIVLGGNWQEPGSGIGSGAGVPKQNTSVPANNYIITVPNNSNGQLFKQCVANSILDLPFAKTVTVVLGAVGTP